MAAKQTTFILFAFALYLIMSDISAAPHKKLKDRKNDGAQDRRNPWGLPQAVEYNSSKPLVPDSDSGEVTSATNVIEGEVIYNKRSIKKHDSASQKINNQVKKDMWGRPLAVEYLGPDGKGSLRYLKEEFERYTNSRNPFERTNPDAVEAGELYQKDMLLTEEQLRQKSQRKAISSVSKRWTSGNNGPVVPYVIGDGAVDVSAVQAGIDHWQEHTCLTFEAATDTSQPHLQFIQGSGCWSYVGMIQTDGQQISIGSGCESLGVVAHEIGHAIGFHHEQSRSDRDNFVEVFIENVESGKEHNFDKESDNNYGVNYDFNSVMHYGTNYFSSNGLATLATLKAIYNGLIGRGNVLSHRDKLLANTMYSCISQWLGDCNLSADPCENEGYIGSDCNCVCPPHTTGANCETITGDYYDDSLNSCTKLITEETTITSFGYPSDQTPYEICMHQIIAPECKLPVVTFTDFALYPADGLGECQYDKLEIRFSDFTLNSGTYYCGNMISVGQTFTGVTDTLVVYAEAYSNSPGYSADVTFQAISNCVPTGTTSTSTTPATTPSPNSTPTPTSTTTTTGPDDSCDVMTDGDEVYWYGVFPSGTYPFNFQCGFDLLMPTVPQRVTVVYDTLDLQVSKNCKKDSVAVYSAGMSIKRCGTSAGPVVLPTTGFWTEFTSDKGIAASGFQLTFIYEDSPCHEVRTLASGDTGTLFKKNTGNCEWWLRAPSGSTITLTVNKMKIKMKKGKCSFKNVLLVNTAGDVSYPVESTEVLCGKNLPGDITSDDNEINVAIMSSSEKTKVGISYVVS